MIGIDERMKFLEQQMQVLRNDFETAMRETGQLFQKLMQMNRTYQQFVEERLIAVEKKTGEIPADTEALTEREGKDI